MAFKSTALPQIGKLVYAFDFELSIMSKQLLRLVLFLQLQLLGAGYFEEKVRGKNYKYSKLESALKKGTSILALSKPYEVKLRKGSVQRIIR